MKLSEKILYCRKRALLSQESLAERIGVSRQAISKWETGEAMPEVSKLLQLAQTFGVTTDWLLSEEEPELQACPEPTPQPEVVHQAQPVPPEAVHTWVDDVPGMLGKLLRKYGWLFGVRLAVSGALFLAFGLFASLLSNSFFNGVDSMTPFGGMSSAGWYDENGNRINDPVRYFGYDVYGALGMQESDFSGGFDSEFSGFSASGRNMFGMFSGFIMLLGAVQLIVGIILAIELKKLDQPPQAP